MRRFTPFSNLVRLVCIAGAIATIAQWRLPAQQQQFRQYGAAQGLANLNVRCILQDQIGFLWIGTDNGLFRFDGATFRKYGHDEGLPSTEINILGQSPTTGQVWVGTANGLVRYDAGRFVHPRLSGPAIGAGVRQIAFDHTGSMYLLSGSEIVKGVPDGSGGYTLHVLVSGDVHGMLVQGDSLYFGRGTALWHLQAAETEEMGSAAGLPKDDWAAIARDSQGNLWVRSTTRLFEQPARHDHFVDRSRGVPHALDPQLSVDRRGRLYVSTLSGAVVFDGQDVRFLDVDHGLPPGTVSPILVDHNDSLWLGMNGSGLVHQLGHGEWTSWKRVNGLLHDTVWAIQRDSQGNVWVGTSGGLTLLGPDGIAVRSWSTRTGLPADRVLAIQQAPSGDIFVGTDPRGLTQFSPGGKLLRVYADAAGVRKRVTSMSVDRHGRLWVVGNGGVYRSDAATQAGSVVHFTHFDVPGLDGDISYRDVIITEDDVVWIITSHGLCRYADGRWRVFTTADGLLSDDLDALAERNGALWVAYRDALGMTRFTFDGQRLHGTNITSRDGLSSDDVYALAFDRDGRLWANNDKGVDVLEDGHWRHFSSEDGLVWDDTNSRALHTDDEGNVWIGTSGGLSRYVRPPYPIASHTPTLALTEIRSDSKEWQPDEKAVLPSSERRLSLEFAAAGATSEGIHFRYRLRGFEDSWIDTSQRAVQFAGLQPGSYDFEVTAQGPNGAWETAPAHFYFVIRAPWWKNWYFFGICSLLTALLGRLVWRVRMRVLLAQKARLQHVVEVQTAELREQHRRLQAIAYLDHLTTLPNRRMFTETLDSSTLEALRSRTSLALLLIDLDRFKLVNDNHGHDAGDAVLAAAGARMRGTVETRNLVARLGGDEFAILLEHPITTTAIDAICKRIIHSCTMPITVGDEILHIGCSIGVAIFPADADTAEGLYKAADVALYNAKRDNRNGFSWYNEETSIAAKSS